MPTEVIKSIGSGADYATIALWEDATDNSSLITADEVRIGELKKQDHSVAASVIMQVTASWVDATRFRQLRAASNARHDGAPGVANDHARVTKGFAKGHMFEIREPYFRFGTGFEVEGNAASAGTSDECLRFNPTVTIQGNVVDGIIFHNLTTTQCDGVYFNGFGANLITGVEIRNCAFFEFARAGVNLQFSTNKAHDFSVLNCSFHNCGQDAAETSADNANGTAGGPITLYRGNLTSGTVVTCTVKNCVAYNVIDTVKYPCLIKTRSAGVANSNDNHFVGDYNIFGDDTGKVKGTGNGLMESGNAANSSHDVVFVAGNPAAGEVGWESIGLGDMDMRLFDDADNEALSANAGAEDLRSTFTTDYLGADRPAGLWDSGCHQLTADVADVQHLFTNGDTMRVSARSPSRRFPRSITTSAVIADVQTTNPPAPTRSPVMGRARPVRHASAQATSSPPGGSGGGTLAGQPSRVVSPRARRATRPGLSQAFGPPSGDVTVQMAGQLARQVQARPPSRRSARGIRLMAAPPAAPPAADVHVSPARLVGRLRAPARRSSQVARIVPPTPGPVSFIGAGTRSVQGRRPARRPASTRLEGMGPKAEAQSLVAPVSVVQARLPARRNARAIRVGLMTSPAPAIVVGLRGGTRGRKIRTTGATRIVPVQGSILELSILKGIELVDARDRRPQRRVR